MKAKTAILIGAGARGARAYAPYALKNPHELNMVAVAEPNKERRDQFQHDHRLQDERTFASWEDVLALGKIADIAIICTQDRAHFQPTMQALKLGYDVLLEKPMSPNPLECIEMERAAKKHGRVLTICHVLRYTPFWMTIRDVIAKGTIGDVASIQLNENVEVMHMSHSFVRGNWKNKESSSPMILQKSCHDMDVINYIIDKKCERISSYGSLMHFKEENKPTGAPKRCLDGCPVAQECPFHAGRFYLGKGRHWAKHFTHDASNESIIKALQETDYGKCVYQSDNNVVDHQVVNMEFAGGATATFSMCGFTRDQTRDIQVMGTKGEIRGNMEANHISIYDFLTQNETIINLDASPSGHGGGDDGIIRSFLHELNQGEKPNSRSSASTSLHSHLMAFAAETSRLDAGRSIDLDDYYAQLSKQT